MPVWFGIFGVLAFCAVLMLRSDRPTPGTTKGDPVRMIVLAAVVAAAGLTFSASAPQRFDRINATLEDGTEIELAYVAEKDDDLVVAACDRSDGVSTNPTMLRVAREKLGEFTIRRGSYAFYTESDPSLFSIVSGTFGRQIGRPPSLPEFFDGQWGIHPDVDNICGSALSPTPVEQIRERLAKSDHPDEPSKANTAPAATSTPARSREPKQAQRRANG
jgi:hypothetical protein